MCVVERGPQTGVLFIVSVFYSPYLTCFSNMLRLVAASSIRTQKVGNTYWTRCNHRQRKHFETCVHLKNALQSKQRIKPRSVNCGGLSRYNALFGVDRTRGERMAPPRFVLKQESIRCVRSPFTFTPLHFSTSQYVCQLTWLRVFYRFYRYMANVETILIV